jgi:hypothetical protein
MATTTGRSDLGLGLTLALGLVAVGGAVATAALSYQYAIVHAAGEAARGIQINGGIAFTVAILAACLSVAAVHLYG